MQTIFTLKTKSFYFLTLCFWLLLFSGGLSTQVRGITPTPSPTPTPTATTTPSNPELDALKQRNAILEEQKKAAEYEKAIAEAKKAELAAEFPKPSSTPLEGKTEVDANVKIESEMMAYRAMANAADLIVDDIKSKPCENTRLAIYNDRDVKTMLAYNVTTNQLILMKKEYESLLTSPPRDQNAASTPRPEIAPLVAGITAATSIIGSFVDLLAFFRTDTTVKGMSFKIEESALVSEVFRSFRKKCPQNQQIYYPLQFSPHMTGDKKYIILGRVDELYYLKARAERLTAEIGETEKALKEGKEKQKSLTAEMGNITKQLTLAEQEVLLTAQRMRRFPKSFEAAKDYDEAVKARKALEEKKAQTEAAQNQNNQSVKNLEAKLGELYQDIQIPALPNEVSAAVKNAQNKSDESRSNAEKRALKKISDEEARLSQGKKLSSEEIFDLLAESEKVELVQNSVRKFDDAVARKLKEASVERLKTLNARFNKFYDDLTKVDAAVGVNAITSYLQAENLKTALGCNLQSPVCDGGYFLQLAVLDSGGNNRVKKNLITNVFTGADITHSGGAIVEYKLYDINGAVHHSNTFTVYEYYRKPKSVTKLAREEPK